MLVAVVSIWRTPMIETFLIVVILTDERDKRMLIGNQNKNV